VNRVLVIDKPRGLTSHDVVARVRRALRVRRVGHAGTLDPEATGVLVVLVGKATRLAQFLMDLDKRYRGRVVLGKTTDTQDATGTVLRSADPSHLTPGVIEEAFSAFRGEIEQVPPMVSALKHEGTPLYVLARRGEVVERQPRRVRISDIHVRSIELPEVEFEVTCSKGTYVRTLAADIGERLGCGAHLGNLAREAVGPFVRGEALRLDDLSAEGVEAGREGYSMFDALSFMQDLRVTDSEEDRLSTGGAIEVARDRLSDASAVYFRVSTDGKELIAVGRRSDPGDGMETGTVAIRPVRVFVEPA
jgi:tRNA pseudouridine55 synthase